MSVQVHHSRSWLEPLQTLGEDNVPEPMRQNLAVRLGKQCKSHSCRPASHPPAPWEKSGHHWYFNNNPHEANQHRHQLSSHLGKQSSDILPAFSCSMLNSPGDRKSL